MTVQSARAVTSGETNQIACHAVAQTRCFELETVSTLADRPILFVLVLLLLPSPPLAHACSPHRPLLDTGALAHADAVRVDGPCAACLKFQIVKHLLQAEAHKISDCISLSCDPSFIRETLFLPNHDLHDARTTTDEHQRFGYL